MLQINKIRLLIFTCLLSASLFAQKIYWVDAVAGKVQSANLNGTGLADVVTGAGQTFGIAVDQTNSKIYWIDNSSDQLYRSNLDGTGVTVLINTATGGYVIPRGIAIDVTNQKIYWSDNGTGKIRKANLDGTGVTDLVTGLSSPGFIALDPTNQKLYWADNDVSVKKIKRCNASNGSSIEDVVTGLDNVWGIALDVNNSTIYWIDSGIDKLQKGSYSGTLPVTKVDVITGLTGSQRGLLIDGAAAKMYWSDVTNSAIVSANVNGTGAANLVSSLTYPQGLSINWNSALPVELSLFSAAIKNNFVELNWKTETEVNSNSFVVERTLADEVAWINAGIVKAKGNSNSPVKYSFTDANIISGNKYLYRLKMIDNDGSFSYSNVVEVSAILPDEFILEQNHPNPFNPITSIRYSIPQSFVGGVVTLKIFDNLGNEVASLVEEQKSAGVYEIKFDASNLASGTYVYRLTAGSFVQSKKMILLK